MLGVVMTPHSLPTTHSVQLTSPEGALAVIAPELGGWLLRYARPTPHGLVDALHFNQAVVDRYPKEMWAGNPLLFPMVSFNHLPGREHHYAWAGREFPLGQHGYETALPPETIGNNRPQTIRHYQDKFLTGRCKFSFIIGQLGQNARNLACTDSILKIRLPSCLDIGNRVDGL